MAVEAAAASTAAESPQHAIELSEIKQKFRCSTFNVASMSSGVDAGKRAITVGSRDSKKLSLSSMRRLAKITTSTNEGIPEKS